MSQIENEPLPMSGGSKKYKKRVKNNM